MCTSGGKGGEKFKGQPAKGIENFLMRSRIMKLLLREWSLFTRSGAGSSGEGVKSFVKPAKGGGTTFWTRREGGEQKISDLIYFFQITEIQCFLEFLCVLG